MPLSDFTPEKRSIQMKGGSFDVGGLSLQDVAILVREHLDDLQALFELFEKGGTTEQFKALIPTVVTQAPGFVANVIALAAGEPEGADNAMRLPAPVQIEAVTHVVDLTFGDVGGIKKAMEQVTALLGQNRLKTLSKTTMKGQ